MKLSKDQLTYSGEIPERFTLDKKLLPPVQNQNGDNRCAAYAISGIMTVMARLLLGEELDFSKAYIYGKYRAEGDSGGNGGMFESQIVNICEGGACLFSDMPDNKRPRRGVLLRPRARRAFGKGNKICPSLQRLY